MKNKIYNQASKNLSAVKNDSRLTEGTESVIYMDDGFIILYTTPPKHDIKFTDSMGINMILKTADAAYHGYPFKVMCVDITLGGVIYSIIKPSSI